jgi:hypothetical protein
VIGPCHIQGLVLSLKFFFKKPNPASRSEFWVYNDQKAPKIFYSLSGGIVVEVVVDNRKE